MSEKCPLDYGLHWESDQTLAPGIPEVCRRQCEATWEEATKGPETDVDILNPDCKHAVEYGDMSLQRGSGGQRYVGLLYTCVVDEEEAFSQSYKFECPNN